MEQTTFIDLLAEKEAKSIALLQTFEQAAVSMNPEGYYLAYSGGKDSDVLLHVALKAGVKFAAHYNVTGIDPTDVIRHIKVVRAELADKGIKLYMDAPRKFTTGQFEGLPINMYRLVVHKKMPPTMTMRYCCSELKEHGGEGQICLTGVRWAESSKRKWRKPIEVLGRKKNEKMLFDDNDDGRMQFENCVSKNKRVLNPIIAWTDAELWQYIKQENIEVCNLYSMGWKRIGCIGCPMAILKEKTRQFQYAPYVRKHLIQAFEDMLKERDRPRIDWHTGEDVMAWWIKAERHIKTQEADGQTMFDESEG